MPSTATEKEAQECAKVITSSVESANQGIKIVETTLLLVELIRKTTPEKRRDFLILIQESQQKGTDKASGVLDRFVGQRKTTRKVRLPMEYANYLVLESPVQSGLLSIFGKTETETGL